MPAGRNLPEENSDAWRPADGSVVLGYGVGKSNHTGTWPVFAITN